MNNTKTNQVQTQVELINRFLTQTEQYKDLMEPYYDQVAVQRKNLARDAASSIKEGRLLRIAVVGQVKAGKSSFLNAALFDGNGVLPKAATPMTAALTIIRHAPAVRAEVEFYDQEEWHAIERAAVGATLAIAKGQLSEEEKAACEVVEMAKRSGLEMSAYLGKRQVVEGVSDIQGLMSKLEDFVGVNGRFTPIVRSTIVEYNHPALEGVEIIDTPGINDPVVSRGRRTKEHLGQCDVVFMLSRCGRFIDKVDMEILAQNLPSKGIRDIVLVGTQLDTEMYGEHKKYPDIQSLLDNLEIKLEQHAADTFENLQKKVASENEQEILQRLKQALPPIFISAMANNIAHHFGRLDEEEQHFLKLYNKMYTGLTFEPELLRELSNMSKVTDALDKQKEKKERILCGRLDELLKGTEAGFRSQTAAIRETINRDMTRIRQGDLKSMQEKEKTITRLINKGKNNVEGSFESLIIKVRQEFELLKTEVARRKSGFGIKEHKGIREVEYTVSTSRWYNPFSWWGSETRTRPIPYRYANVHEAIDQVEMFVNSSKECMQKVIIDIVDLPRFRSNVREAAMSMFDLSDSSFDVDWVAISVERAVNRITLPEVDFGARDYTLLITSKFSGGQVTETDVDSLIRAQREALRAVFLDFEISVKQKTAEITAKLEKTQTEFVLNLTADIQNDLNKLREQLKDRENTVRRYQELLDVLGKWDKELQA